MRLVSALFVDPDGPYPRMDGVDCWDERRNAYLYEGTSPVVAHPPCGPWGDLAHKSKQDPEAAPFALGVVRRCGGVLEHPARSRLWAKHSMPTPGQGCDKFGGFTVYVEQVSYGHVTRKPTWLYVVRSRVPKLLTGGTPTRVIFGMRKTNNQGVRLRCCTKPERRLTPQPFAELLVSIARSVD